MKNLSGLSGLIKKGVTFSLLPLLTTSCLSPGVSVVQKSTSDTSSSQSTAKTAQSSSSTSTTAATQTTAPASSSALAALPGGFTDTSNFLNGKAVLLPEGRIINFGMDTHGIWSVQSYDLVTMQMKNLAGLLSIKVLSNVTLLQNGKILATGLTLNSDVRNAVELYDPSGNGSSTLLSALPFEGVYGFNATLLPTGKVLFTGTGFTGNTIGTPETGLTQETFSALLYDPSGQGSFRILNSLNLNNEHLGGIGGFATSNFSTSTLLPNGKVLVTGGWLDPGSPGNSVKLYDPSGDGSSTVLTPMHVARIDHTATLLPNGKVLIVGGGSGGPSYSVELYDPSGNGSSVDLAPLNAIRYDHSAIATADGHVLIVGGINDSWGKSTPITTAELYDITNGGSSKNISMNHTIAFSSMGSIGSSILSFGGFAGWSNRAPIDVFNFSQ